MKALAYAWFFIISTHVLGRGAVDHEHDDRVSMEPIQQDLAAPPCWIRAVIIAARVRVLWPHPMVSHCFCSDVVSHQQRSMGGHRPVRIVTLLLDVCAYTNVTTDSVNALCSGLLKTERFCLKEKNLSVKKILMSVLVRIKYFTNT